MNPIKTAIAKGQTALSEFQSKRLLNSFGIPVTQEKLALTADQAIAAAEQIGYPVVLKACAWELMHKSELGCIELNLTTPNQVQHAYTRICEKTSLTLEGVLVQEMVEGRRELMMGVTQDPQFGTCVMLGFGGVLTEVIKDTVFRVAPFDNLEALDMVDELKSRPMLDAFRGQAPADLDTICRSIIALGKLGQEQLALAEIDINPLIITPDGALKAVDALIILKRNKAL